MPSLAVTTTLNVPTVVGTPLIKPVAVFSDKPAGSPVAA